MIIVAVLQNYMCFVEGETGSCSETSVNCDVVGTEQVINVEETIEKNNEIPEAIKFPPIKTEHEVSFRGICNVLVAHALRPFIAGEVIVDFHLTICSVPYFGCHMSFEIWIAILKI